MEGNMETRVIDNNKSRMVDALNHSIKASSEIRIAVAFAKSSGFNLIKPSLDSFINNNGRATFLIGLNFQTTDPHVLREFSTYSENYKNFEIYCLSGNLNRIATFHPKLYLFNYSGEKSSAIVGSSNLTRGGLIDNVEINIEIKTDASDEVFEDLFIVFQQLQFSQRRIIPNSKYIENYEELYKITKKGKKISQNPKYKELKELEQVLPTAEIETSDLIGWMKLVYEHLPHGEFTTHQMYQYEQNFKEKYPDNQNIRAKIRQQLQFLEKIGLIEKISRGSWFKKNN